MLIHEAVKLRAPTPQAYLPDLTSPTVEKLLKLCVCNV